MAMYTSTTWEVWFRNKLKQFEEIILKIHVNKWIQQYKNFYDVSGISEAVAEDTSGSAHPDTDWLLIKRE